MGRSRLGKVSPPSTSNVLPVRKLPAGEAKYTAAAAMSTGSPSRRSGVACSIGARSSSLAATTSSAEVRMEPGAIALTRTRGHRSSAASRV
ncbi:Uncharacterised protein [Mycobacterium tuberculosis]|nr:Uncharacterised protein [Mycobacterium tuberculosis]